MRTFRRTVLGSDNREISASGAGLPIVARLLDSNTGQFTIIAASIFGQWHAGAGEFVSKPALLEKALRKVLGGWQSKNLEFVLQTDITDTVAGPSVVAYYSW